MPRMRCRSSSAVVHRWLSTLSVLLVQVELSTPQCKAAAQLPDLQTENQLTQRTGSISEKQDVIQVGGQGSRARFLSLTGSESHQTLLVRKKFSVIQERLLASERVLVPGTPTSGSSTGVPGTWIRCCLCFHGSIKGLVSLAP